MKAIKLFVTLFCAIVVFTFCDDTDKLSKQKGLLEFKCINPMGTGSGAQIRSDIAKAPYIMKSVAVNPPLVGDTTETIMTSMKIAIGDIWVSKGIVKAGETDNLEWIRLSTETNTEIKLFEDYHFQPVELPVGEYKSIKMTLRNIWYRQVKLASNPEVVYNLLETMGSSTDVCDENDTSWAKTNFFGTDGNHVLTDENKFQLASEGEKIAGFKIENGKKAIVSLVLGAGATESCTNYLIDKNGNREFDCGIDEVKTVCPPSVQYMFGFSVEYE